MTKRLRAGAEAGFVTDQRQQQSGAGLLPPSRQARLEALAVLADCQICVGDTVFTGLHRLKLAEASGVLRGLFDDVDDSNSITLHDNTPEQVALMLSLLYLTASDSLTLDNAYAVLAMCAKYDMADIQSAAETYLLNIELTVDNLPDWLQHAARADFEPGVKQCLRFAYAADNLSQIMQRHVDSWMHALPAKVLTRLLAPKLRVAEMARCVMVDTLDVSLRDASVVEVETCWPDDAILYRHSKGSVDGRPIDRDTIRVVLEGLRRQGEQGLEVAAWSGVPVPAAVLQSLLPAACEAMDDPPAYHTAGAAGGADE